MNSVLILVDIQNDFLPGGTLEVAGGDAIIPVVNRLQPSFSLVVATQDWHPAGHGSFASTHPGKAPFQQGKLDGLDQVYWPDHCVQGSKGAEFHSDLRMEHVAAIFRKGMDKAVDSYSGFFDNAHRNSTGLAGYLREKMVEEVYICGLAADYCVGFTALDALKEGFTTYVIEDATRPISEETFISMKQEIGSAGGQYLHSKECVK